MRYSCYSYYYCSVLINYTRAQAIVNIISQLWTSLCWMASLSASFFILLLDVCPTPVNLSSLADRSDAPCSPPVSLFFNFNVKPFPFPSETQFVSPGKQHNMRRFSCCSPKSYHHESQKYVFCLPPQTRTVQRCRLVTDWMWRGAAQHWLKAGKSEKLNVFSWLFHIG